MNSFRAPRTPAIARLLVRVLVARGRAELILGDLEEDFTTAVREQGAGRARRAYWRACLESIRDGGRWHRVPAVKDHRSRRLQHPLENTMSELRHAARSLLRRPAYTLVMMATLATAIAATSAAFAVVHGVLLRPLPYAEPHELVTLWQADPERRSDPAYAETWNRLGLARADIEALHAAGSLFSGAAGYRTERSIVRSDDEPEELLVGRATLSLLPVLGIGTHAGTWFADANAHEAVVTYAYWARTLQRDPRVIGRSLTIDGRAFTISGVLPRTFGIEPMSPFMARGEVAVWIPAGLEAYDAEARDYEVIARMAADIPLAEATSAAQQLLFPAETALTTDRVAAAYRRDIETAGTRRPLLLLFASVGIFLLLAFVSLSVLTLGEAQSRQHELATRMVLGASRLRISAQMLTESTLIALPGAAAGLLCAAPLRDLLLSLAPGAINAGRDVTLDGATIAFTAAVATFGALAVGAAPSLTIARAAAHTATGGARTATAPGRLRHVLLVTQFALTTVLLLCCGMLTRSLVAESSIAAGFATDNRLIVQVRRPSGVDPDFARRVRTALQSIAGVERVAVSGRVPMLDEANTWQVMKQPDVDNAGMIPVTIEAVSDDYFTTMGIPLVAGRPIAATDTPDRERVAVVSVALANRLWPDQNALGRKLADPFGEYTIVGVVADVRDTGLDATPEGVFYPAKAQSVLPGGNAFILLTRGPPLQLAADVRRAVRAAAPGAAVLNIVTLEQVVSDTMSGDRFRAIVAALFAILGVLIGTIGLSGLIIREVSRRLKELAIRMALGAAPLTVAREPMTATIRSIALGGTIGLIASIGAARALAAYLFGVSTFDPVAALGTIAVLSGIVLLALIVALRRTAAPDLIRQLNSL